MGQGDQTTRIEVGQRFKFPVVLFGSPLLVNSFWRGAGALEVCWCTESLSSPPANRPCTSEGLSCLKELSRLVSIGFWCIWRSASCPSPWSLFGRPTISLENSITIGTDRPLENGRIPRPASQHSLDRVRGLPVDPPDSCPCAS